MQIGYARVSTRDQHLDLQRNALRAAGCEKVFEETGSGVRADRPALQAALAFLRPGDTLVVWKLDRLGRTVRQLVTFITELETRGIHFQVLTDGIDTTTAPGRFFFHVMAAMAEMERDLIRERTQAGLSAARARGRHGGRPRKLTPTKIAQARLLLGNAHFRVADVAATLGVSVSTLYRSLRET